MYLVSRIKNRGLLNNAYKILQHLCLYIHSPFHGDLIVLPFFPSNPIRKPKVLIHASMGGVSYHMLFFFPPIHEIDKLS